MSQPCGCHVTRSQALLSTGQEDKISYCPLHASAGQMREALVQIAKGKGRFSRDHHEHAENTIEDMKALALNALAAIRGQERVG